MREASIPMALWENLYPGPQETEVPAPAPQCIGLSCVLEQTLHKADLITSAHLGCIHTTNLHCNVAMAGIKSSMYGFSWKPW